MPVNTGRPVFHHGLFCSDGLNLLIFCKYYAKTLCALWLNNSKKQFELYKKYNLLGRIARQGRDAVGSPGGVGLGYGLGLGALGDSGEGWVVPVVLQASSVTGLASGSTWAALGSTWAASLTCRASKGLSNSSSSISSG